MTAAFAAASTDDDLLTAMEAQLHDRYALTSQSSRASCLRTWILFHEAVPTSTVPADARHYPQGIVVVQGGSVYVLLKLYVSS